MRAPSRGGAGGGQGREEVATVWRLSRRSVSPLFLAAESKGSCFHSRGETGSEGGQGSRSAGVSAGKSLVSCRLCCPDTASQGRLC